jgi:hypothetical protein
MLRLLVGAVQEIAHQLLLLGMKRGRSLAPSAFPMQDRWRVEFLNIAGRIMEKLRSIVQILYV